MRAGFSSLPPWFDVCRPSRGGGTLRVMAGVMTLRWAGSVRWRKACRVFAAGTVVAGLAALGGCAKPLLSPNEPRSQYSRYDLVRGQFAPQYVEDEFGRRMPNLRGRLLLPEQ